MQDMSTKKSLATVSNITKSKNTYQGRYTQILSYLQNKDLLLSTLPSAQALCL